MGKAKPTKHSAGQLESRAKASLQNAGGGAAGMADRRGGAAGHARFQCTLCGVGAPSLKNMESHHESRHGKIPWDPTLYEDVHAKHGGVTTQGVAIRGTTNDKKLKAKKEKGSLDSLLDEGLAGAGKPAAKRK